MSTQLEKFILGTLSLANFTANGTLGVASATVDVAPCFAIAQTTGGITLTIPSPTTLTPGAHICIINTGTVAITVTSTLIGVSQSTRFVWSGTIWTALVALVTSTSPPPKITTFTINGTWTPDPLYKYAIIECQGGGAGGSNCVAVSTSVGSAGAGGGGGGFAKTMVTVAQAGLGGRSVIVATVSGGNGNTSSVPGICTTTAALTGITARTDQFNTLFDGGQGGTYTIVLGTDVGSANGSSGTPGIAVTSPSFNIHIRSGSGGAAGNGGGGSSGRSYVSTTPATAGFNGNNGLGFGAGGSGAVSTNQAQTGGVGGAGFVRITEWF